MANLQSCRVYTTHYNPIISIYGEIGMIFVWVNHTYRRISHSTKQLSTRKGGQNLDAPTYGVCLGMVYGIGFSSWCEYHIFFASVTWKRLHPTFSTSPLFQSRASPQSRHYGYVKSQAILALDWVYIYTYMYNIMF